MSGAEELRARAVRLLLAIPDAPDRVGLVAQALDAYGRECAAAALEEAAEDLVKRPADRMAIYARAAELKGSEEGT